MERTSCSLGCILASLGLALSCCLLPYLVSSIYSIVTTTLQVQGVPDWLWGDWLYSVVGDTGPLYMILAEGPICCVGALGLLIVIFGLILSINSVGTAEPAQELSIDAPGAYPSASPIDPFDADTL
jgi:hypothetical protein